MLYLILNESGQPEHRWSIDPDKDFVGLTVFGEAIRDQDGNYADSAWLEVVGGEVKINQAVRAQKIKEQHDIALAEDAARLARAAALDRIKNANVDGAATIAALRVIVKDLVELLK